MENPTISKSQELYSEACKVLPGGISRNTIYRKPNPDYVQHGNGCRVTDIDGVERIDFANNMCSLIHGHAHQPTVDSVIEQLRRGSAFTLATEVELRYAQHLCNRSPHFDKVRFMNSGTEAVMCAIKASRAITGRPKIAKTEGSYHGTYDYAEVSQKARPENWGDQDQPNCVPVANGTPQGALDDVVVFPFNDLGRTIALLDKNKDSLAAILVDLLPHRVGLIPAQESFIRGLREWATNNECMLIFDEVITFRMGYAGAAEWFDVAPDLTAMGKIIGGGFPVGAVAGKADHMYVLDPSRESLPFPHSGTFSANPITMTAGLAAMEHFDQKSVDHLNDLGAYSRDKIEQVIGQCGAKASVTGAGSMFRIHLKETAPTEYRSTFQDHDEVARLKELVKHLYDGGFMMINTCSGALSTVMDKPEIDNFADVLESALKQI